MDSRPEIKWHFDGHKRLLTTPTSHHVKHDSEYTKHISPL